MLELLIFIFCVNAVVLLWKLSKKSRIDPEILEVRKMAAKIVINDPCENIDDIVENLKQSKTKLNFKLKN